MIMRVLILGGDGYLGWPTAMRFSARGHDVYVLDNFSRRRWHHEHSTDSLTPIRSLAERIEAWREVSGHEIKSFVGNIEDGEFLDQVVAEVLPETIIHYGEQPSAPFSMMSRRHATHTQYTNVIGTLNLLFSSVSMPYTTPWFRSVARKPQMRQAKWMLCESCTFER